jgi:hypothetical protein
VNALESRLAAVEHRVGNGPATADLDEQIAQVRRDKESAIDAQDFERAGSLRDRESQLLAGKTAGPLATSLKSALGASLRRARNLRTRRGPSTVPLRSRCS